jgi:hypothetical protein
LIRADQDEGHDSIVAAELLRRIPRPKLNALTTNPEA